VKFPKFLKNQGKILIEFQDCVIQANDMVDFQILVDDNQERAQAMIEYEQRQTQSLEMLRGVHVSKDAEKMRSFNHVFEYQHGKLVPRANRVQQKEALGAASKSKMLAQASQSRGTEVLIRKFGSKKADENRRTTLRRPVGPNAELKGVEGIGGRTPICAAELEDESLIFNHLVNTSLLTAPLLQNFNVDTNNYYHVFDYEQVENKPILSKNIFTGTDSQVEGSAPLSSDLALHHLMAAEGTGKPGWEASLAR